MMRRVISAWLAAAVLFFAAYADAVELCAAVDGSGSIIFSGNDFELQLEGLAAAVEDASIIPRNSSVFVAVVLFGGYAEAVIPRTLVNSAAAAQGLAADIRDIERNMDFAFWHLTDMAAAIDACRAQFYDPLQEWIVDLSTDGAQNGSADPLQARDEALLFGLDVVNAIGVGAADIPALEALAWPQPSSDPPEQGFVITVATFSEYIDAMRFKVRSEVTLAVDLDIKPGSCPNAFNRTKEGVLPVAIPGGAVDVYHIDPSTILLEGVAPLRWSYEDVTRPAGNPGAELSCVDCTADGPDGIMDLTLKFDAREIAALLGGNARGDCLLLSLTGALRAEYGSRPLSGDDSLRIVR